jgi:hypothetical protein
MYAKISKKTSDGRRVMLSDEEAEVAFRELKGPLAQRDLLNVATTPPAVEDEELVTARIRIRQALGINDIETASKVAIYAIKRWGFEILQAFIHRASHEQGKQLYISVAALSAKVEEPKSETIVITPGFAYELLLHNPDNRALKIANLDHILRDLMSDHWSLTGQAVIVSICGLLNDGQHRLIASILLGKSFKTMVTYGVTRESRLNVDTGWKREPGDRLEMLRVTSGRSKAAILAMIFEIEHGRKPTDRERDEMYENNAQTIEDAYSLICSGTSHLINRTSLGTAAFFILKHTKKPELFRAFIKSFKCGEGQGIEKGGAILALREALVKDRIRGTLRELAFTVIQQYNLFATGRKSKQITRAATYLPKIEA